MARLLDREQAAEELGVATSTMDHWRSSKTGPRYVKVGGLVRYRESDLEAYIERQTVEPEGESRRARRKGTA